MATEMTVKERLTRLETKADEAGDQLATIRGKVDQILENHLPHLNLKIEKTMWQVGFVLGAVALISQIAISIFLKVYFK